MRRWGVIAVAGGVAVVSLLAGSAPAAKPRTRRVVEPYAPFMLTRWHVAYADPGFSSAELLLVSRPGENAISVEVEDDLGTPVRVGIEQDGMPYRTFCRETEAPMEIIPREPFYVVLYSGHCLGGVAVATEGVVEITFQRGAPSSRDN